jgi:hypothetical protein
MPDAVILARLQFAFTMASHIVFPAFSIGLASYLAVLEGLWLITGRDVYLQVFGYWLKIFALVFGMGVVSGIAMSYQFGTNWSVFSDKTGPVLGPLMGYEVIGGPSFSIRPSRIAWCTWCSPLIWRPRLRSAQSAHGTCCGTRTCRGPRHVLHGVVDGGAWWHRSS